MKEPLFDNETANGQPIRFPQNIFGKAHNEGRKMEIVKIQHYVPRCYLKNFSSKKGKSYFLNCFDKSEHRKFQVSVKGIGCEKFFYEGKNEKQVIEKALSNLEKDFSTVYNKLVKTKSLLSLNWNEKEIIANFVALQDLRTREFREHVKSIGKEMKRQFGKYPLSKEFEEQLTTVDSEDTAHSIQMNVMADLLAGKSEYAKIILAMKWILFENPTKLPLWTSDHPVNRYNPVKNPLGNLGLKSKGIQVFFPLNPKFGILFCDAIEYFWNPEKVTCAEKHITFNNSLQVMSATRHIFSMNDNFHLAEKVLKDNPELADPYRQRVSIN